MKYSLLAFVLSLSVLPLLTSFGASAKGLECQKDNPALRAMSKTELTITRADGSELKVVAKLADNNRTRAAGFQRVCASTIAAEPILFVFQYELKPQFHMNNVVAPIDIAFIDKLGKVVNVQAMQPYVLASNNKPLYGPDSMVIAALEAHPGFFEQNNIDLNSVITWQSAK